MRGGRPRIAPRPPAVSVRPVSETLREYARGAAGGLLFSLPLLYTMEVWWTGHTASPLRLLALLGGTVLLLLATSWAAGLRPDHRLREDLFEVAEELALGFATAAVVLLLLGQLPADASLAVWVGKLTVEGAVCALGVSVGTAQLGQAGGGDEDDDGDGASPGLARGLVGEAGFAALGAVLIAANVAPTEEVVLIAAEATRAELFGVAVLSLAGGLLLLLYSDARAAARRGAGGPLAEAAVTYAVGLAVSAVLLWVFGRFDAVGGMAALHQTVVLAFPATLGAAVGRLLLNRQ